MSSEEQGATEEEEEEEEKEEKEEKEEVQEKEQEMEEEEPEENSEDDEPAKVIFIRLENLFYWINIVLQLTDLYCSMNKLLYLCLVHTSQ